MMRPPTMKRIPSLTKIPSTTVRNVTVALPTKSIATGFITAKMADLASDHAKEGNIMTVTEEIVMMRLTVDLGNQNQVIKSIFSSLIENIVFHSRLATVTDNLRHIHYTCILYILQIGVTIPGFRDPGLFLISNFSRLLYAKYWDFRYC